METPLNFGARIWQYSRSLVGFSYTPSISWLFWISILSAMCFLGSITITIMVCFINLCMIVYKYWYKIEEPFENGLWNDSTVWDQPMVVISYIIRGIARIWHGYEICGIENIPETGPALLVFYHGPISLDMIYVKEVLFWEKRLKIRFVTEKILIKILGWKNGLLAAGFTPGPYEDCLRILRAGHLLGVAPGGAVEGLFGEDDYSLLWKERKGFARLALEAKVPIIPVFTQNIREAFNFFGFIRRWNRSVYKKLNMALPAYGGLPVKMRTYFGEPIPYDPQMTPEELAEKTKTSIKNLIAIYQQLPVSVSRALLDRFHVQLKKSA